VLIIHGMQDRVADFENALEIHRRCKHAVEPLWIEKAGHNDIDNFDEYYERLVRFIKVDLAKKRTKPSAKTKQPLSVKSSLPGVQSLNTQSLVPGNSDELDKP